MKPDVHSSDVNDFIIITQFLEYNKFSLLILRNAPLNLIKEQNSADTKNYWCIKDLTCG